MSFQDWWQFHGCRTVGGPEDYARAAWEAALRAQASGVQFYQGGPIIIGSNAGKTEQEIRDRVFPWQESHHRTD